MTSNNLLLYRLAELMLELEQHFLLVDLLFDDNQIGDFVKSIQIDSPYQQMVLEGVLTESVREEKLFVSFTVEGYFHYVLGEVIYNHTNGKGPECLKQIVEENKLNGAKEGVEQCLIRDVLVNDLTRLMWLIDEGGEKLKLCIIPLSYSLKSNGIEITIEKLLEIPTDKDWEALLKLFNLLNNLQLNVLIKDFLTKVMPKNQWNTKESITLGLNAIDLFDKDEAFNYLVIVNTKVNFIKEDADLLFQLGNCEKKFGDYKKALIYYDKCLEIDIKILGPEHHSVALLYHNIGSLWNNKGYYNKAIKYYQKSLDIIIKIFGKDDTDVARLYNSIGLLFNNKGDYEKALEYYFKSLGIMLKTLGANHTDVATLYNNIGYLWNEKGDFDKAIKFYNNCLNIRLKTLSSTDPSIATIYNNIGSVLSAIGDNEKAIEFNQSCLDIRLISLGSEHPDVATSYNNIGLIWHKIKDYDKALELYQKCLNIKLKTLGLGHPDVASSYNNIGAIWNHKSDFEKAIYYYNKCLKIRLNTLGKNHPDIGQLYNNIGTLYYNNCNYTKSLFYYKKSLKILINSFGKHNPNVIQSYFNIGLCLMSSLEYHLAIKNFLKAYKIYKKGGFPFQIAKCYESLNHPYEALNYYIQSAEIRKEDPEVGIDDEVTQEAIANAKRLAKELNKENELPKWMKKNKKIE